MTISYTAKVATCGKFGCFLKLLFRWRGSIYKLVWMDLICFLTLYYSLTLIYCFALNSEQQSTFESIVKYCDNNSLIPLSFVLGFYVAVVMTRWWSQYLAIPWPDSLAVYVSAHIQGHDERGRIFRRTVMRYVCLCLTIALRNVCPHIKRRYPTWDSFIDAGLLVENEKVILSKFSKMFPSFSLHWMPIVWSASIATRARNEGRIRDDLALQTIVLELNKFRGSASMILHYDWISIPLVYTQVVTLAVYSYFACSVMAKQWIAIEDKEGYMQMAFQKYFPLLTTLEFFFYMGWLKVAESLINPFGDDDDDFEINWIINRNLLVSYLIVDEMHHDHPELVRDQYWDEVYPTMLPCNETNKCEGPPVPSNTEQGLTAITSDTRASRFGQVSAYLTRPSKDRISLDNLKIKSSSSFIVGIVPPLTYSKNSMKLPRFKRRPLGRDSSSASFSNKPSSAKMQDSEDDFERLKKQRENERLQRHRDNILKTVDNLTYGLDNVSTLISLFPPRHILITSTDSDQSSIFVDPPDERFSRQETASAENTNSLSGVEAKSLHSIEQDDFERLKKERQKIRNDRMKFQIAKFVHKTDAANAEETVIPSILPSEIRVRRIISIKKFLPSAISTGLKISTASLHSAKLEPPTADQQHLELKTDSEVSSIYLDVNDSTDANAAIRFENLPRSQSLPNIIRHSKSLLDILEPQKDGTSIATGRDDVKVTTITSRPWLSTRSTLAKRSAATASKFQVDAKAIPAQTALMFGQPSTSVQAESKHHDSIKKFTPEQHSGITAEVLRTNDNDNNPTPTLSAAEQRWGMNRSDSDTSIVNVNIHDATARSRTTPKETEPDQMRVTLTQGRNVLPVASETSTLYTDLDEEPSEEWFDPSGLSMQKKESKS